MIGKVAIDPAALNGLLLPYDRSDAPGFAVGVALGGIPAFRRGVGMASIELPVVLSPSIRMRIGSTSKHFTALAVMLLAEEGRLSISDSPKKYLPELPTWADRITLRQMLDHTSGMRCSLDLLLHSAGPGVPTPIDYHLKTLAALDSVNFAPGMSWNYNNGAYALLAEIVTRVGQQPFFDFMAERIFKPVGMYDTLVRPLDTDLIANSATLHVPSPAGGYVRGVFGAPISGEGAIVSTVDDMLSWLRHMSDPIVGSPETWQAMRSPNTSHGYALGLISGRHRGLNIIHHAGVVFGGSCQMLKVVDYELDIIVITNGLSGLDLFKLVDAIIDCCIPGLPPEPEDMAAEGIAGIFYSADTGRRLALEVKGDTQTVRTDGSVFPARRNPDGWLDVPLSVTGLRFAPQADGESLIVEECGKTVTLHRLKAPRDAETDSIVGRHVSSDVALVATIAKIDDGSNLLTLSSTLGGLDYALTAIGPGLWEGRVLAALPAAILVEMTDDGFLLTTGRTQRLKFVRLPADVGVAPQGTMLRSDETAIAT